jgi:hypothetical protein
MFKKFNLQLAFDDAVNSWQSAAIQWRRARYANPLKAAEALSLIRDGSKGSPIELRFRVSGGVPTLYVGMPAKWMQSYELMARDFGFDAQPDTAPKSLNLKGYLPGNLDDAQTDADALITAKGMYLASSAKGAARSPKENGAPIVLPEPSLGLSAAPDLSFFSDTPSGELVWHAGEGGLPAQSGLVGERASQVEILERMATEAFANGRPTVIIDGTGQLAHHLRQAGLPRRVEELNIARAGQRGFNPLAESQVSESVMLARWKWWWRGLGVEPETVTAMREAGVTTVEEAAKFLASVPAYLTKARAASDLLADGAVGAWIGGHFDVAQHLGGGGHLLVECGDPNPFKLQALRGVLGLALEGRARVASLGVRWLDGDDNALSQADALCAGRMWRATAYLRCAPGVAAQVASRLRDPKLAEYLVAMPRSTGIANEGALWWTIKS